MTSQRRRSMNPPLPQITEEDSTEPTDIAEPYRRDIDIALGTDADRAPRNAFAEGGLRLHRHRLAGNAFYQEAFAQRKNTPPTETHPAFRYGTDIYDISQALPELDADMTVNRPSLEMQQVSPRHSRDRSRDTTMSNFINADVEERSPSPPLRLVPSPQMTHPTLRNTYDERHTDAGQQDRSSGDNFVTTTRYSPKVRSQDFGHHSQQFESANGKKVPASPKKSLLDRFRPSNRRGGVPLQPLPTLNANDGVPQMPVKARAVLVAKPPSHSVARSPSKTKGFWSRHKPSADDDARRHNHVPALKQRPQAAHAVFGKNELPGVTRALSLGYVDDSVPPTPLPKDTPPDEKARQEYISEVTLSRSDSTPTRNNGMMSLNDRLSPDKYGGYSMRGNPKLVTQASTHSLRASVVPTVMDGQDFDATEDRINGLGMEGISVHGGVRQQGFAYSPSCYSPDVESMALFPPASAYGHRKSKSSSDAGISDMGDISIIYPELARDPSITSFMTPSKIVLGSEPANTRHRSLSETLRHERMPTIRRRDIDVVLHEVDDMLRGAEPSPSTSGLFAIPVGHASAQVSPLHLQPPTFSDREVQYPSSDLQPVIFNSKGEQILPATTYNPWDVQQQSNHSPSRERRLRGEAPQTTFTSKKNTADMPGLQYDSGVDVDPQKLSMKQSATTKYQRSPSPPRSSTFRKENLRVDTNTRRDVQREAKVSPVDIMGRGDTGVKDLIASYQQTEIGHRLSDLEQSIKQDAAEQRRKLEQDVLFDQRIASLEIARFSQEPSPTICYDSPSLQGRRDSHRKSLSPAHAVADRKKTRKVAGSSSIQPSDVRSKTKRISTGDAKNFYQNQLRDSPVRNEGNIEKSAKMPESSTSSGSEDTLRLGVVGGTKEENETIRQLQGEVRRQNEVIQAAMARMEALELKYEGKSRG